MPEVLFRGGARHARGARRTPSTLLPAASRLRPPACPPPSPSFSCFPAPGPPGGASCPGPLTKPGTRSLLALQTVVPGKVAAVEFRDAEYGINQVEKIEGLPGVWFANQLDVDAWLASANPSDPSTAKNFVRSRMSFNGGATWQPIPPPTNYNNQEQRGSTGGIGTDKCNTCTGPNCFLQLSGPSQWSYS